MKTLSTAILALGVIVIAASAAHASHAFDICVNNSSGTVRIVSSCTVGTNLSPCHHNETCIGSLSGQPFATNESFSSCSGSLCIDAPPQGPDGLDGSGGWGYDSSIPGPVTTLTVGTNANLTVTALQLSPCSDGTITLTYSSYDFSYVGNGDSSATCQTSGVFLRGGVVTCSYTDFAHTAKSDSFTFTPKNPTNTALVTATVDACGQQASETFPVAIEPAAP
jgi:hypothetical protein